MGALPNKLPGFQDITDEVARKKFETLWAVTIPSEPGWHLTQMFEAMEHGELRALFVIGENPAQSEADSKRAVHLLESLDHMVVLDLYLTKTAQMADVVLPVAPWGEKEWTSTNSERTVSYSPKLFDPPGEALPDWQVLARFARTLGIKGFDYGSAAEVWDEFIGLTAGRPCDLAGATSTRLRREISECDRALEAYEKEIRDLGESVLVLGHIDLTAQTTGIRFHEEVGQLGTFRDGKIATVHDYLSHREALEAAGLEE